MDIEKELTKFNVTDAAISELSASYMPLVITGINDISGAKIVSEARKIVASYRINIDKKRKELNADALEYQRRINGEAKRITALLEPIETHLIAQEQKIKDEVERIEREKQAAEAARLQERINLLIKLDFKFNGFYYASDYLDTFNEARIEITTVELKEIPEKSWMDFVDNAKHYHDRHLEDVRLEKEKRAREEAEQKAERERLAQERKDQEAEKQRLAKIAQELEQKAAALKAEEERINASAAQVTREETKIFESVNVEITHKEIEEGKCTLTFPDGETVDIKPASTESLTHRDSEFSEEQPYYRGYLAALENIYSLLSRLSKQQTIEILQTEISDCKNCIKEIE